MALYDGEFSYQRAMDQGRAMLNYEFRAAGEPTSPQPQRRDSMSERKATGPGPAAYEAALKLLATGWRPDPCVCGTERINGYCGHCRSY